MKLGFIDCLLRYLVIYVGTYHTTNYTCGKLLLARTGIDVFGSITIVVIEVCVQNLIIRERKHIQTYIFNKNRFMFGSEKKTSRKLIFFFVQIYLEH